MATVEGRRGLDPFYGQTHREDTHVVRAREERLTAQVKFGASPVPGVPIATEDEPCRPCPSAAHRSPHANVPEPIATFYQLPSSAGGLVEAKREGPCGSSSSSPASRRRSGGADEPPSLAMPTLGPANRPAAGGAKHGFAVDANGATAGMNATPVGPSRVLVVEDMAGRASSASSRPEWSSQNDRLRSWP